MAKEAVCNNKTCFKNKCLASAEAMIKAALEAYQPVAILLSHQVNEEYSTLIDSLPETADLPRYNFYDVKKFTEPVKPEKSLYLLWDEERESPCRTAKDSARRFGSTGRIWLNTKGCSRAKARYWELLYPVPR
ncbi:hypothetical protein KRR40_27015 [Niabella defluvii]|nr:hypothetical protein KRR40_27015 [Niabella sp. I65]